MEQLLKTQLIHYFNMLPPPPKSKPKDNTFYASYKHDPSLSINNHVYKIVGVGYHTEDDCRPDDIHMVVYKPIYESSVYTAGKFFDIKPLTLWMSDKEKDGQMISRYVEIIDPSIISQLEEIEKEMYS